jgi:hydrogenase nickel incorporation protein HypB
MCETCGCGKPEEFTLHIPGEKSEKRKVKSENEFLHEHDGHWHSHPHDHEHHHAQNSEKRKAKSENEEHHKEIPLNIDILSENNRLAEWNRGYFEGRNVTCFNLVSSPGSGKTTLLEKTIAALNKTGRIFVIEGDQQTSRDAERIARSGAPAIQVNTGSGCHLDATMVHRALERMEVEPSSLLFIENVGNLVCPALFDLGEKKRVVVISVTEGDDKPLKYPYMFRSSHLCIINKTDLLPYVDFSTEDFMNYARQMNPELEFLPVSAKTGEGMQEWYDWISKQRQQVP